MRQEVFYVQHSFYIVRIVLIYGNSAVIVFLDAFQHFAEITLDVDVHNVLSAGHYLLSRFVTKTYNTLQQFLFVFQFFFVCQFQGLFQVVNAKRNTFFSHHFFGQHTRFEEHCFEWPKEFSEKQHARNTPAAEQQGGLSAQHLGHDFAKEQQKECKEDGEDEELQPIGSRTKVYHVGKHVVKQHDYGNIHKVVCDENGCQRTFRVFA